MDVKKFQYFIAIAEEQSISRAARRLYISQPALTQFLTRLEEELETKLFERIDNRYIPTAAGKIYLNGAYSIVATKRETYNLLSGAKSGMNGELTVALSHSQTAHRSDYFFLSVKECFPNIDFRLIERSSEQCPDALNDGLADIGIVSQPIFSQGLTSIPLWYDYPLLVTNQDCALDKFAVKKPDSVFPEVTLNDMANQTFISMTRSSHVRQVSDELFLKLQIKPKIVFECSFVESLIHIVESTNYVSIVPMGLLKYNPNLHYYSIKHAPRWSVAALYRDNMALLDYHKYFIDIAKRAPLLETQIRKH